MWILIPALITVHVIVCFLLVFVVLMQRPKSEGLGAAFGGGMTDNMFGAQTSDVLQKATVWLGGIFFVITLALAVIYAKKGLGKTEIERELMSMPLPTASPAATEPLPEIQPSPVAATPPGTDAAVPAPSPSTETAPSPAAPEARPDA